LTIIQKERLLFKKNTFFVSRDHFEIPFRSIAKYVERHWIIYETVLAASF